MQKSWWKRDNKIRTTPQDWGSETNYLEFDKEYLRRQRLNKKFYEKPSNLGNIFDRRSRMITSLAATALITGITLHVVDVVDTHEVITVASEFLEEVGAVALAYGVISGFVTYLRHHENEE